jgi:hypothetical protein
MRIMHLVFIPLLLAPGLGSAQVETESSSNSSGETAGIEFFDVTDLKELRQLMVDHSELRDPFSVEFRRVQSTARSPLMIFCGQLNAKNANGAYTGWTDFTFVKSDSLNSLTLDTPGALGNRTIIRGSCKTARIASGW